MVLSKYFNPSHSVSNVIRFGSIECDVLVVII